jgi:BTB/POZ domain
MFDKSKFREGETRCATISDCQPEVFEAFLKFFYTDNIDSDLSLEQVTELYSMAHQYTIVDLKDWTISVLEENISLVQDKIIFKNLLGMAYKYRVWDERISVILLSHLNKQNSNLIKAMDNISVLKKFAQIAKKHNFEHAATLLKEQIVDCVDTSDDEF